MAQVKIQSFNALSNAAKRVAAALGFGADMNPESHLSAAIGSPDLAGLDRGRSWQLAVAMRNPGTPPLLALYVPVTNFETFQSGLQETSPLKSGGSQEMLNIGEFAVVVFRFGEAGALSADEKQKLTAWISAPAAGAHLIELAVQPDEPARQQALQALGVGRMVVVQAVTARPQPQGAPFNAQAMSQMLGLYFDGFETLVKGLHRLEVQIDLRDQTFALSKKIAALPNSELARWFKAGGGGLSDLANQLDAKATISLSGAIGDNPPFLPLLNQLIRLSFQMQNQEVDEKLAGQIDRMMDLLTPMRFVGSVDFAKTMSYSGFYEFPGTGVKEVYASFKQFFTNALPPLTGQDKAYSSIEFKEGFRSLGGNSVDRFSMTLNLNAPMFKMPEQREALDRMWGGGRMEFEYATKGNRLYFAHPDRMAALLEAAPRPQAAAGFGATGNTVLFGRANLLALIKQMLPINPMLPARLRENAERINPEGGDIRFRVNLDGGLSSDAEIPLKILEAFRQVQGADK